MTCYNCQQIGHVSKYCRNRKAQRPELKQPTESVQPTNNISRNSAQNTRNESTNERQTKFKDEVEVREYRGILKSKDDNETVVKNINFQTNAQVNNVCPEAGKTTRAQLFDPNNQEISVKLSVNDATVTAIIDTGSPVTVISKGLFDRMGEDFEENQVVQKSNLKNLSIKLFSCEVDKALATLGECEVFLRHEQFMCVSPVIVAVDLAHDCLIGMNVLVLWPTMKDAIDVLMKARPEVEDSGQMFVPKSSATRLNNICLPKIASNFDIKSIKYPTVEKIQELSLPQANDTINQEVEQVQSVEQAKHDMAELAQVYNQSSSRESRKRRAIRKSRESRKLRASQKRRASSKHQASPKRRTSYA